ncbi:MAG: hypothetical protein ACP5VS_00465 [Desulfomonilaceae bacterium]
MTIDSAQLAMDQLDPVIVLDPTISLAVTRQVEAVTALKGWTEAALTDQQRVYVSLLALKAMIPRLLLKFGQGIKKAKGAVADAEFQAAEKFLLYLQSEVNDQSERAAKEAAPDDVTLDLPAYPAVGVKAFRPDA